MCAFTKSFVLRAAISDSSPARTAAPIAMASFLGHAPRFLGEKEEKGGRSDVKKRKILVLSLKIIGREEGREG
jgi:hypothetical protein